MLSVALGMPEARGKDKREEEKAIKDFLWEGKGERNYKSRRKRGGGTEKESSSLCGE